MNITGIRSVIGGVGSCWDCELFRIKYESGYHANGDGCIGKVEYGLEKQEFLSAKARYPLRPGK